MIVDDTASRVAGFGSRASVMGVQMAAFRRAAEAGAPVITSAHLLVAAVDGLALRGSTDSGEPADDLATALAGALDRVPNTESGPDDQRSGFTPLSVAAQQVMDDAGFRPDMLGEQAVLAALTDLEPSDAVSLLAAAGVGFDDLLALGGAGDGADGLIDLDLESFDVTIAEGTTMVDYWAEWCRPCVAMLPVLRRLASLRPDITVARVDIEAEPELRDRLGARSVPVLVVYRDGAEVSRHMGACGLDELEALLDD